MMAGTHKKDEKIKEKIDNDNDDDDNNNTPKYTTK